MKQPVRTRFIVIFLAIGAVLLGTLFLVLRLTSPSDGARLQPGQIAWAPDGVIITPLQEQSGSLRKGDVVVAVAGQSMEELAQALFNPTASHPQWEIGQSITYTIVRDGQRLDLPVMLQPYPLSTILIHEWSTILFALVFLFVATFVFLLRPDDRAARIQFLIGASITGATTWSFGLQVSDLVNGIGFWLYTATTIGVYTLFWIVILHFVLVFPKAHPIINNRSWVIPLIYIVPYASLLVSLVCMWPLSSSTFDWVARWSLVDTLLPPIYLILAIAAVIWNYQANRDAANRQKIRWLMFAALISGGGSIFIWYLPTFIIGQPLIDANALGLLVLPYPLVLPIAILRYHLFDIDILLNRTLVYGTLTISIVSLYVLTVSFLGLILQFHEITLNSLLATGLVAVIFHPLRTYLQRLVNRLMYGERDEPYTVLSRLSQRLEATLATDKMLPTIVETIAQALKLPYAAVTWKQGDEFVLAASYGLPEEKSCLYPLTYQPQTTYTLPLLYQSETIGQLVLAPRAPGDPFSAADRRLLEDIAHQTGIAAYAIRLTLDLQRSRERLVTAREEERRRLRRDLHDGLGPTLASMTLKLDAARNLLTQNSPAVDVLLTEIKQQMQTTIIDIRRLVYDLRPPALDELGLVPALREQAIHFKEFHDICVTIEVPQDLPALPAAIEVAIYRIVLEALTNVARHAEAQTSCIRLWLTDTLSTLHLEVLDDGQGLPSHPRFGVGIASMRERATELGGTYMIKSGTTGGTHILVQFPLAKE